MDITVLSDLKGNMFEPVFKEFGYTCQQILPQAFNSPFCPPTRLLVIPTGFASPTYYRMLPALERCKSKIEKFIENGGIVLAYGALINDYEYTWLPMKLVYQPLSKKHNVNLLNANSPGALLFKPGPRGCDGYFAEHDGDVVMAIDDGKPVLVHKKFGEGHIIASGMFDYPDKKFIEWACPK
jgi:hypothetical protein